MAVKLSDHFTYKKLFKAMIPSVLMMLFTSLYTIVDGVFVSNLVGKTPFAALNLIWPVISIIGAIGFMLGAGGSALVAKTLGEGDAQRANKIFSMVVYFTAALGAVCSVVGAVIVEPIAIALGATPEMLPYCVEYGRILLAGEIAFMLQVLFNSFFIVAEKPLLGFAVSIISGTLNIIFDAVFIAGFKWGISGAAAATLIGQVVGTVIPIIYFSVKNKSLLRLVPAKLELKPLLRASTNGASEFLSNISMSLVNMLYNIQLLKYIGEDGIVAYGVMIYLAFIFSSVFLGYSIGSAPLIGYHYGAQNHSELKNLLKKSLIIMIVSGVLVTALAEGLARPLSMIFVSYDAALLDMTTFGLRIYSVSFILVGVNIFASSFFTALNNGLISGIISVARTLLFQIFAIMVMPLIAGVNGIWSAVIVAEGLAIIVSIIFFAVCAKRYHYEKFYLRRYDDAVLQTSSDEQIPISQNDEATDDENKK